ncbi:MAG: DUF4224 domain-containing protein [Rhodanobacteraceae bacterium]
MSASPRIRLSRREVADLCGSTHRAKQRRWLQNNGVRHYLDPDGAPVVLWRALDGAGNMAQDQAQWKSNKVA